jgi:DNA-binding transcriptional ArsR family regulator
VDIPVLSTFVHHVAVCEISPLSIDRSSLAKRWDDPLGIDALRADPTEPLGVGVQQMFNSQSIPEQEVYTLLSNPRRLRTLDHLRRRPNSVPLRELSEIIAAAESGETPAPRQVRATVYVSLHQTHLPKLDELGIVDYDRDRKEVRPLGRARQLGPYMDVMTRFGVSWGGFYRWLGVVGLFVILTAQMGLPGMSVLDPLLWTTTFLGLFALSTAYQLWGIRRRLWVPMFR